MKKAYEPSDEVNYYLEFYNAMQDSFDEPTNRKALAWICEKCGYGTQHYVQTVRNVRKKTPSFLKPHNSHNYLYEHWR